MVRRQLTRILSNHTILYMEGYVLHYVAYLAQSPDFCHPERSSAKSKDLRTNCLLCNIDGA